MKLIKNPLGLSILFILFAVGRPSALRSQEQQTAKVTNLYIMADNTPEILKSSDVIINFDQKDFAFTYLSPETENIQIPYIELQFWDGFFLFDSFQFAEKRIHTKEYLAVYHKFQDRLKQMESQDKKTNKKNSENSLFIKDFNSKCAIAFRSFFKYPNQKELPKLNQCFIFCFDNASAKKSFNDLFIQKYTNAIKSKKNLLDVQLYQKGQQILLQFYDPLLSKEYLKNPPVLYTSFQQDGMVLQKHKTDTSQVLFSFRYDQIIDCNGVDINKFRDKLPPEVDKVYKSRECCVGLEVAWDSKPLVDMFCSLYRTQYKCEVDAKLFRASMFRSCITTHVNNLYDLFIKNGKNLDINYDLMELIPKMKIYNIARQIKEWTIEPFIYDDKELKRQINEMKPYLNAAVEGTKRSIALDYTKKNGNEGNKKGELDRIQQIFEKKAAQGSIKDTDSQLFNANVRDITNDYKSKSGEPKKFEDLHPENPNNYYTGKYDNSPKKDATKLKEELTDAIKQDILNKRKIKEESSTSSTPNQKRPQNYAMNNNGNMNNKFPKPNQQNIGNMSDQPFPGNNNNNQNYPQNYEPTGNSINDNAQGSETSVGGFNAQVNEQGRENSQVNGQMNSQGIEKVGYSEQSSNQGYNDQGNLNNQGNFQGPQENGQSNYNSQGSNPSIQGDYSNSQGNYQNNNVGNEQVPYNTQSSTNQGFNGQVGNDQSNIVQSETNQGQTFSPQSQGNFNQFNGMNSNSASSQSYNEKNVPYMSQPPNSPIAQDSAIAQREPENESGSQNQSIPQSFNRNHPQVNGQSNNENGNQNSNNPQTDENENENQNMNNPQFNGNQNMNNPEVDENGNQIINNPVINGNNVNQSPNNSGLDENENQNMNNPQINGNNNNLNQNTDTPQPNGNGNNVNQPSNNNFLSQRKRRRQESLTPRVCEQELSTEHWSPIKFDNNGVLLSPLGRRLPVTLYKDGTTLVGPTGHVLPYSLSEDKRHFIDSDCQIVRVTEDCNGRKRPWLTMGTNGQLIGADGKVLIEENLLPEERANNPKKVNSLIIFSR